MKLGPLNKVMGMIPGIPQFMMQKGQEEEGGNRLKRFMFMMDSMTDGELDGQVDIAKSVQRMERIAYGSGTSPDEIMMLLKCHKQFEKVVGKMGKTGLMKGDASMNKQMMRNPNAVMSQLSKAMDPRMLQQMGGAGNLMNMMKQMSKDPNMMNQMQGMMGGAGGAGGGMPPGMMDMFK
jgi:signal recognition particle subunit SRP54